jgi:hypothetical protein
LKPLRPELLLNNFNRLIEESRQILGGFFGILYLLWKDSNGVDRATQRELCTVAVKDPPAVRAHTNRALLLSFRPDGEHITLSNL